MEPASTARPWSAPSTRPAMTRWRHEHVGQAVDPSLRGDGGGDVLGMIVLGAPAVWAMGGVGIDWNQLSGESPGLMFLGMATTMTMPMVGWMVYRGHGRRANAEM